MGPITALSDAELEAHLAERAAEDNENPLAVFMLPPSASAVEVRRAYLSAAKQYHPYRFAKRSEHIRMLVNEFFIKLNRTHSSFRNAARRAHSAPHRKAGPHATAPIRAAGSVASKRPHSPERESLRKFARASAQLKKKDFESAVTLLKELTAASPSSTQFRVFRYYAEGQQAMHDLNDLVKAAECFELSLEADPNFYPAQKALDRIRPLLARRR